MFSFLSGPPDVARLVQRHDVRGLIKATAYRRTDINHGHDPGCAVRRAACVALGELKAPESIDALVTALFDDPDHRVQDRAVEALRAFCEPRLIPVFRRVLEQDRFLGDRGKVAARALREIGSSEAVAALVDTSAKNSSAESALREITTGDESVVAVLTPALHGRSASAVAEALGNLRKELLRPRRARRSGHRTLGPSGS